MLQLTRSKWIEEDGVERQVRAIQQRKRDWESNGGWNGDGKRREGWKLNHGRRLSLAAPSLPRDQLLTEDRGDR